jgi:hypothetical protein
MALTKFDIEILQKAMSILGREKEFNAAEEIRMVLMRQGPSS